MMDCSSIRVENNTVYAGQPAGNRLDCIPIDNSLNNNICTSILLQCTFIVHLDNDNKYKFSLIMPKIIVNRTK